MDKNLAKEKIESLDKSIAVAKSTRQLMCTYGVACGVGAGFFLALTISSLHKQEYSAAGLCAIPVAISTDAAIRMFRLANKIRHDINAIKHEKSELQNTR